MKRAGRWALALAAAGALMLGGCSGGGGGLAASGPPTTEEVAAIFAGDFSAEAAVTVGISEETDDSLDLTALVTKSDDSCLVEVTAPEGSSRVPSRSSEINRIIVFLLHFSKVMAARPAGRQA